MIEDDWQDEAVSWFQRILPPLSAIIFVMLSYVPIYFSLLNNIRPDLGLIAIYFWMMYRPDLFDLKSVAAMGIVDGIMSSSIFGLGLFTYLVMYLLMTNLRKYFSGRSFIVIWYGFMAFSLAAVLAKWLIASIYHAHFLPVSPLLFSYLTGAAVYPLVSTIFAGLQKCFLQDDDEL